MKLHFNPSQKHQLDAVNAVVRVFKGQPAERRDFSLVRPDAQFANRLAIDEKQILKNVRAIQRENQLDECESLDGLHFSVEMETGTGKTYVYLRTVYELNKVYGFKKFVIVVPSVAIREGVLKNLSITHDHLQHLYGRPPAHFSVYDSRKVSGLRDFALSDAIQILVINIDSFAKDANVINRHNDKLTGEKPIDFIRRAHPLVIVDEPQNMETVKRKRAIEELNYLCTLRYSATHVHHYNRIYNLDPVRAHELGLVKQIEVDSVRAENDFNAAYVRVKRINVRGRLSASLEIDCNTAAGVKRKKVTVRSGDDLYEHSGQREMYRDGYIVNEIDAEQGRVAFSGVGTLRVGEAAGGLSDEMMKIQIRETVAEHFKREKKLQGRGIKVISLFFIDRVANYRRHKTGEKGKFARWFEAVYQRESGKKEYAGLIPFAVDEVHNGYFSAAKEQWKDTSGNTKADDDTFRLIMKDKERLLDPAEPLRFIFSHSALREGWDNPNVFQICTLNETQSELKKRQEIGRGMRLAVDRNGNRVQDAAVNRLTVIANESYEDFARQLQNEIEQECGVDFGDKIKNKRQRREVKYRKGFQLDENFKALWDRIKYRTTYRVEYDTATLIDKAAQAVKDMGRVDKPSFHIETAEISVDKAKGVTPIQKAGRMVRAEGGVDFVPDILSYVQSHERARLTRDTVYEILRRSGRLGDALKNPQMFADKATDSIEGVLAGLMEDGIKYEKIGAKEYELRLFEGYEFHRNDHTFKVSSPKKTINEGWMPLDSGVEHQFAQDCESRDDIEFYFKLPPWFKIKTPIGNYNPDWALIKKNETAIYFVAETKSKERELRPSERRKIKFGAAHARQLGMNFRQVSEVKDLDSPDESPAGK